MTAPRRPRRKKIRWTLVLVVLGLVAILWTWRNVRVALRIDAGSASSHQEWMSPAKKSTHGNPFQSLPQNQTSGTTKILGFADYNYREYAIRWFHRLEQLGYTEHVIVAVDTKAVTFFEDWNNSTKESIVRFEALPYPPCVAYKREARRYRQQIFGRRWKYVYEQLQSGYPILMTDVDNVFSRKLPMKDLETSPFDVFHAYSTSYPTYVFEDMGFTVCGGMSWLRATPKVVRFVGSLLNECGCLLKPNKDDSVTPEERLCQKCQCDDQVVLNELLWKGKHKVVWNQNISKPTSLKDWRWEPLQGVSSKTKHKIAIWDRHIVYRAPMPETCPENNWVSAPLYVDRDVVVETWDRLCGDLVTATKSS